MVEEKGIVGAGPFFCPKCRATTSGRYAYCPECGEPLDIQCPNCGFTWRFYLHHSFCPSCGKKAPERAGVTTAKGWG